MPSRHGLFQGEVNIFRRTGDDYSTAEVLCVEMRRFRTEKTCTSTMPVLRRKVLVDSKGNVHMYERAGIKEQVESAWFERTQIKTLVIAQYNEISDRFPLWMTVI